jgi:hypothetical protein
MSCENTWYDVYFTQLFTTLGQLTAVVLSTSVSVPVISYYYPAVNRLLMSWSEEGKEHKLDTFTKYTRLCYEDANVCSIVCSDASENASYEADISDTSDTDTSDKTLIINDVI